METQESITETSHSSDSERVTIAPMDEYNTELVSQVHPPSWINPTPKSRYHLVVIGAGTAGLVTAAAAAGLGAKVALIERHLMGGDCLNVGCVPSKAVIRAAKALHDVQHASNFGVNLDPVSVDFDFGEAMQRMRKIRAGISHHDSADRFKGLGVDVFLGQGEFLSSDTIEVAGTKLKFKKAVIATGARAATLPIEGLSEVGYLDNETVFSLTDLPKRMAVIGAGPIGCELAQSFQRFGSKITLIQNAQHILPREDREAAEVVEAALRADGMTLETNANLLKVRRDGADKVLEYEQDGERKELRVDEILVGVGRAPNVEGIGLERVGVEFDPRKGVKINDYFQTSNPKIYAAGDIAMQWKFTHAADFAARAVIQNTLFFGRKKLSSLMIPWATYTDPEIAHVGKYAHELEAEGAEFETFTRRFAEVDRALTDGETDGFVKMLVGKKGKILGCTIVNRHAGDLISEVSVAMAAGMGLGSLANVIHPYPTQAEAIRQLGDAYNRTKLTPFVKKVFGGFLKITG